MIDINTNGVRNEKSWLVINIGCSGTGYCSSVSECPAEESPTAANQKRIVGFALKSRLASVYGIRAAVETGGLM